MEVQCPLFHIILRLIQPIRISQRDKIMEKRQHIYNKTQSSNVFLMKKKSRVKNIFIQKVNSSVSLKETREKAQKQNNVVTR